MDRAYVTLRDIEEASRRVSDVVKRTPLWPSRTFSSFAGSGVYLKMENLQRTGSFKVRGALNKIRALTEDEKAKGVIAASAGNHAQGVALAASMSGIRSTIVMPETAPLAKIEATRGYGAEVVVSGVDYDESYGVALEIAARTGATFIHAFDDPFVIAGQGTAALEIAQDINGPFTLVSPIGGGGLAAGLAVAVKESVPGARVIGVQAEGAKAIYSAIKHPESPALGPARTIADGIAVRKPGRITLDILREYIDDVVCVSDDEIAAAILVLLERAKVLAEGAGACAAAAVLSGKVKPSGGPAVLFVSGGNLDAGLLANIIQRGLVKSGRQCDLAVILEDRPGALAGFLKLVSQSGANVVNIDHDRSWTGAPLGSALVEVSLETRDREHARNVWNALREAGYRVAISQKGPFPQEIDQPCGIIPEEVRP